MVEVKKNIENVQGADVYPAAQQMLIYQGKVLKDDTTLDESKVAENSFIVVMLSKVSFLAFVPNFSDKRKLSKWKEMLRILNIHNSIKPTISPCFESSVMFNKCT